MAPHHRPRILVTRPDADAAILKERLIAMGLEPVLNPLLSIAYQDGPALNLDGVQAILITSANGMRAFMRRNEERDLPVFTVGDTSAQVAREAGFKHVQSAASDVHALAALVRDRLTPETGALLHVAASRVAGDLIGELSGDGFDIHREILYEAQTARHLQTETIEAMKQGQLDAALLYSPRTAKTFVSLIEAAGLETACRSITIFCLSAAVGKAIERISWRDIRIAPQPNQNALLEAVAAWANKG